MAKVSRRALRLSDSELEAFLRASRWGRLATANADGEPHITPLGYVYFRGAIYLHALKSGRRARDLAENPKVAFLVDDGVAPGDSYRQRRGVILYGSCVVADDDRVLLDEGDTSTCAHSTRRASIRSSGAPTPGTAST